jgi:drug/metabolite transporter (DMT)-like permease
MRSAIIQGLVLGVVGGLATLAPQLALTPANTVLLSMPIALIVGVILGVLIRRSPRVQNRQRVAVLAGSIAGGGLFLGMVVGSLMYLALPSTQDYYRRVNQGLPAAGPPFGSYLMQDSVGT